MTTHRTILIVGATGHLGDAVSKAVVKAGFGAAFTARDIVRLRESVAGAPLTSRSRCYQLDLRDDATITTVASQLIDDVPDLGGIVNCAAGFYKGEFSAMTDAGISELVAANFTGVVTLMHRLLPLLERNAPADIINITSVSSATTLDSSKSSALHIASKAALGIFDTVLGRELAPAGVRVTTVAPSTFAKKDRPGLAVADVASLIVHILEMPADLRVEMLAVYPNGRS